MSDSPLVLVLSNVDDPQLNRLSSLPHMTVASAEEAARATHDAQVLFFWSGTRDLLRQAFLANPQVKWVHSRNAGLDSILFPEIVASPVPLTNGSGVFSQSLGEFALTMILYFAKDLPRMLRNKAARRWEVFDLDEISGLAVGIVGYGDIGRAVASRAHAMGMKVLALKRHAPAAHDALVDAYYKPSELHAMLAQSDYVAVCAPLTRETHHMISDAEFTAMKRDAVIINVGRGPVVDQAALLRALSERKIRGAGLDVFEKEPIAEDDPIWTFENVFISPHTADHTRDWLDQAVNFFVKQYESFCAGKQLQNVVDKHLGY
jgi:phosphoglycerate dehydrogenase-like enzyme